jgi:hypothetical protein
MIRGTQRAGRVNPARARSQTALVGLRAGEYNRMCKAHLVAYINVDIKDLR